MNSSCNFWARFGRLLHCIVTSFIRERGKKNNLITGCYGEETEGFFGEGRGGENEYGAKFVCLSFVPSVSLYSSSVVLYVLLPRQHSGMLLISTVADDTLYCQHEP